MVLTLVRTHTRTHTHAHAHTHITHVQTQASTIFSNNSISTYNLRTPLQTP